MKKYFYSIVRYFLIYLLGFIAFFIFDYLFTSLNEFLSGVFPEFFKIYNPITSRIDLIRQKETIALLSGISSVFVITLIAVKGDNLRYEFIISQTEGLYTIRDGFSIYRKNFLLSDIIPAVFVPLSTVGLTLISVSENDPKFLRILADYLDSILAVPYSFTDKLGFLPGVTALLLISLAARLPVAYLSLANWRGNWLSSIEH